MSAWIPVLKQWEYALESATVELGTHSGGGHRLAEAATFIAFLRNELEGILEHLPNAQADSASVRLPKAISWPEGR